MNLAANPEKLEVGSVWSAYHVRVILVSTTYREIGCVVYESFAELGEELLLDTTSTYLDAEFVDVESDFLGQVEKGHGVHCDQAGNGRQRGKRVRSCVGGTA